MSPKNTSILVPTPVYGLLSYEVHFCANWPLGPATCHKLHYQARDGAHAMRQFNAEMVRNSPLGFTWFFVSAIPSGTVND